MCTLCQHLAILIFVYSIPNNNPVGKGTPNLRHNVKNSLEHGMFVLLAVLSCNFGETNVTIQNVTISPRTVKYASAETVKVAFTVLVPAALASNQTLDAVIAVCPVGIAAAHCSVGKGHHFTEHAGGEVVLGKVHTDAAWWMTPPGDFPPGRYNLQMQVCDGLCVKPLHPKEVKVLANAEGAFEIVSYAAN